MRVWWAALIATFVTAPTWASEPPWKDARKKFAEKNTLALQKFEAEHFPVTEAAKALAAEPGRRGPRTEGLLIIKDGELLYERYDRGYTPERKHIAWSVSKSVMSLLYGVALREKKFSLDDSVCKFGDLGNARFCRITFAQALGWTTGIEWIEEYEKSKAPKKASILAMLYGEGRRDMMKFVAGLPMAAEPGTRWLYSSGDSMLLSYLLGKMYPEKPLHETFREKLFAPIGARDWMFETDAAGTVAGAYYLHISARDLARVGELVLNDGRWRGRQILDAGWMKWARQVTPAFKTNRQAHDGYNIGGGHWWLNDHVAAGMAEAPLPTLPRDAFMAMGHWGQYLIVVPSLRLIVVRIGDTRDSSMGLRKLARSVSELLGVDAPPVKVKQ